VPSGGAAQSRRSAQRREVAPCALAVDEAQDRVIGSVIAFACAHREPAADAAPEAVAQHTSSVIVTAIMVLRNIPAAFPGRTARV
jgi:hypothetical protein